MSSTSAPGGNAPEAQSLDGVPEAGQTSPVLRVLIADDFDVVRDVMRRMLEKLGHVVDEVEDGQEAVEAITARPYDLLLLDLMMPRMSGIDVARWLNAHPEHLEGMTVAVVSASAREERPILNELGISLLLPKPVRRQELTDLVNGLIDRR
jgi:CheY-like chemotaxis protein